MFVKPEPLDKTKHADLKFSPVTNFNFASSQPSAPIPAGEIIEAARHFAVVFPEQTESGKLLPQALLSMRAGENAFVKKDGSWAAPYIPAHIRRYPFILGELAEPGKFTIMMDVGAPQFKGKKGEPLFIKKEGSEDLEPSDVIVQAREFLSRFQQELEATSRLLEPLAEKDVLVSRSVEVKVDDKESTLSGFRVVDPEKLAKLDDTILGEWTRSGLLSIVYAHLHSLGNVRELVRLQPPAKSPETKQ